MGALDQTRAGPLWQCHLCSHPTWCHRWEQLGDGTGSSWWHWELSQHGSVPWNAGHSLLTRVSLPAGHIPCLGSSKGRSPKPLDQSSQGYRSPEQSKKSCSASQAVCHPARCWGPHLGYTWKLVFHKHQISLGLQLPGAAGSGMSSKLLKCIRRGKCCRGRKSLDD